MSNMVPNIAIPRPEYPRPQLVRKDWVNLNGSWQFEIDHGKSGRARQLHIADHLAGNIVVPFCPESKLSGVENKDFMASVWYRREFELPTSWHSKEVLIHFGAVDYDTEVWVNGVSVGRHRGGYTSFSFAIAHALKEGTNVVAVCAEDDVRSGLQPRGKQSGTYHSQGCDYTRTTGIWQTVWLESVAKSYIETVKLIPDPANACVQVEVTLGGAVLGDRASASLQAQARYDSQVVGTGSWTIAGNRVTGTLSLSEVHLWEPGEPRLYDVTLSLRQGDVVTDEVESYVGLRSVTLGDGAILINGKPVFQRLVLDQGFYPEGIYTAPTDADLKKDIELSMGLGFNGARLHEKVFEPRFLYWADQLGYLVWGEYGNWGLNITTPMGLERFLPEWLESVQRDINHPSLVGWCPFNETWDGPRNARQDDEVLRIVYRVTKMVDPSRPVIDTSGNFHVETDVFDIHDYEQNVETFAARFAPMKDGGPVYVTFQNRQRYEGQPYFVSEYGGIWWNPAQKGEGGWGYGERPTSEAEFLARYEGLTTTLLDNPAVCAFCYTQLYDIEQEVNGLYTYDRRAKFDPEIIRQVNSRVAAIERDR